MGHMVERESSAIKFYKVEIAFMLALFFFFCLKPSTDEIVEKPEYLEKTPDDELQKMPHTSA